MKGLTYALFSPVRNKVATFESFDDAVAFCDFKNPTRTQDWVVSLDIEVVYAPAQDIHRPSVVAVVVCKPEGYCPMHGVYH